jgi:ribosome-associated heat shock protein Hsp15
MSEPRIRLDKWLWHARFCKTRSQAARLCASGRIRVNGAVVSKAHHGLKVGDVLTFAVAPRVRIIRVAAASERRGPPTAARTLYEELSASAVPSTSITPEHEAPQ